MTTFPDEAFLALVPIPSVASAEGPEGTLVLIRPKILSARWGWLLRLMKKPAYRVKLDARGTAVWQACDGQHSVAQVIAAVAAAFPEEADTTVRTALFIRELARGQFLQLMTGVSEPH